MDYLWLKALHVAAVLIFIGGIFVQATGVATGARGATETVGLVSRWDQRVTLPAMLVVWLTGALVAASGAWFSNHWLWAKLVLVVALSGLHGVQSGRLRRLRKGERLRPGANSFLVWIAIAGSVTVIAILAVTKPF
ncbi:putative membrane protein [Nitrospirillum amazonense]|uniref:Protoporphyrinogen IX oxidase n=1 Tax=Nitrospirillum amazonense TaxID=28077 RepID=A0A560FSP6_9PROT|nr:CopD family protein [Nitrospirillum amazonense]TWB24540.1 putative membrane protein [Nitrospirillum amazonense]